MPRHAYVNGRYLPHAQAAVHIEDRGYQFADGVYAPKTRKSNAKSEAGMAAVAVTAPSPG